MADTLPRNQDSMSESDMKLQHSHYEAKSSDDDLKQQAHVHMKQIKLPKADATEQSAVSADADASSSASMVSGLTSLLSDSAQKVVDALPAKVTDVLPAKVADVLPASLKGGKLDDSGSKQDIKDDKQQDDKPSDAQSSDAKASDVKPIDAAGGAGKKAKQRRNKGGKKAGGAPAKGGAGLMDKASLAASSVSQQASSAAAGVSGKAAGLASGLTGSASSMASSITAIPSNISNSISGTVNNLKATLDSTLSNVQHQAVLLRDAALHNDIMDAYEDEGLQAAAAKAVVAGSKAARKLKTKVLKSVSQTAASISGASAGSADKPKSRRRRGGRRRGNRKLKTKLIDVPEGESILDSLGERAAEIKEVLIDEGRLNEAVHNAEVKASGVIQSVKASATGLVQSIAAKIPALSSLAGGAAADSQDADSKDVDQGEQQDKDDSSSSGDAGLAQKASAAIDSAKASVSSAVAQLPPLDTVKRQAGQQLHAAKQVVAGNVEQVAQKLPGGAGKQKPRRKGNGDSKPTLDRRAELPSLGTPAAPDSSPSGTGDLMSRSPLAVNSGGSGSTNDSLAEKAKFLATAKLVDHTGKAKDEAAQKAPISDDKPSTNLSGSNETGTEFLSTASGSGGLLDAAKSFVLDKVDQLAMNADDTEPMDEPADKKAANEGVLAKAGKALQDMQDAIADKLDEGNGEGADDSSSKKQ